MPKMVLTCPSCGSTRLVQYREPSRRNDQCRSCAQYKGGRKEKPTKGWTKETWAAECKKNGIPNAKKFVKGESPENHPNWKGGITSENSLIRNSIEAAAWRKQVFERDKYSCVICESNMHLHAHHIKVFSKHKELRFDVKNGVTVCKECHISIVHKGNTVNPNDYVFSYPFDCGYFDKQTLKWISIEEQL